MSSDKGESRFWSHSRWCKLSRSRFHLHSSHTRYQIGQALGGMIIPPASDLFGRKMPYIISSFLFSVSCLVVGVVPHLSAVFVGRFFSGIASAVPSVVISGSVEDQFDSGRRVWIVLLWNAAATAGLAFGPVYAACIVRSQSW